jgi:hypothetical protein
LYPQILLREIMQTDPNVELIIELVKNASINFSIPVTRLGLVRTLYQPVRGVTYNWIVLAAGNGRHTRSLEVFKLLLRAGAHYTKDCFDTCVQLGPDSKNSDILRYMLAQKLCKVTDPVDSRLPRFYGTGATALHLAANFSNIENINVLVEYGANVNAQTSEGYTPIMLFLASQFTSFDLSRDFRRGEPERQIIIKHIKKLLLGYNMSLQTSDGRTAIDILRKKQLITPMLYFHERPDAQIVALFPGYDEHDAVA